MKGALLVNLGSPDSTDTKDVKKYLKQFLRPWTNRPPWDPPGGPLVPPGDLLLMFFRRLGQACDF